MTTLYRFKYKIVEGGGISQGVCVTQQNAEEYTEYLHKDYRNASLIYLELVEVFEKPDESACTADSLIILSMPVMEKLFHELDYKRLTEIDDDVEDVYDAFLP